MKHRKDLNRLTAAVENIGNTPTARSTDRHEADKRPLPLILKARRAIFVSDARSLTAVAARRSFPIMAYVGPNGGGKSLAMVHDTLASLDAGRKVISTVALLDDDGNPHPNYVPFTGWDQLLEARDCDLLGDEMVGIAGSRESARLDVRVQNVLVQLRRRNICFRWSAPNWSRADKIVREVTQSVTECRGYYADKGIVRTDGNSELQLWAPKRLFNFKTFDTIDFEEWTQGKRDKLKPTVSEWFYGPSSRAFRSYNTLDAVSMVQGIQDNGRCDICNGTISIPRCKGHTEDERQAHMHSTLEHFEHENTVADLEQESSSSLLDDLVGVR